MKKIQYARIHIFPSVCAAGAVIMAIAGVDGWGWLLFVACIAYIE